MILKNNSYTVSTQVIEEFVSINKRYIERLIIDVLKKKTIIKFKKKNVSFIFYNDYFLVYDINTDFEVYNVTCYDYDYLITDQFLDRFRLIKSHLPPRLQRWTKLEYFELLRNEIIDALILERIEFYNITEELIGGIWKRYDLRLVITEDLCLKEILFNGA